MLFGSRFKRSRKERERRLKKIDAYLAKNRARKEKEALEPVHVNYCQNDASTCLLINRKKEQAKDMLVMKYSFIYAFGTSWEDVGPIRTVPEEFHVPGQKEVCWELLRPVQKAFRKLHEAEKNGSIATKQKLFPDIVQEELARFVRVMTESKRRFILSESSSTARIFVKKMHFETGSEGVKNNGVALKEMHLQLIIDYYSNLPASVYWSVDGVMILAENSEIQQTVVETNPNIYRATLTIKNCSMTNDGCYYFIIQNYPSIRWSHFKVCFSELCKRASAPFTIMNGFPDKILCGLRLDNVEEGKYKTIWALDGKVMQPKQNITPLHNHPKLPVGEYALLQINSRTELSKGTYTCQVINENGKNSEFAVDPFANTNSNTEILGLLNIKQVLRVSTVTRNAISHWVAFIKYRACYPLHVVTWTTLQNDMSIGRIFDNFRLQQVRIGHDTYASCLTFETLPTMSMMYYFRVSVMCVGGTTTKSFIFDMKNGGIRRSENDRFPEKELRNVTNCTQIPPNRI